jgi:hypothetical protein
LKEAVILSKKFAYVTLATTESFLQGAHLLDYSLKRVNSEYPLVIMVTPNLIPHLIDGPKYKLIPYLKFDNECKRYVDTVNKLQCFTLVEYDRVCFLDADIFVTENFDEIFVKYDCEFVCGIRPFSMESGDGKSFCGDRVIYTPNPDLFQRIITDENLMKSPDDEVVLQFIYNDMFMQYPHWPFPYSDKLLHLSGVKKYWELKEVSIDILEQMTMEQICEYLIS